MRLANAVNRLREYVVDSSLPPLLRNAAHASAPQPPATFYLFTETAHIDDKLICHNRLTDEDNKTLLKEALDAVEKPKKVKGGPNLPEALQVPSQVTLGSRPALGFTNTVLNASGKPTDETFILQAEPRSTEGIIYYLGEIARCNLQLDDQSACTTTPKVHTGYRAGDDDDLFKLSPSPVDRSSPSESKSGAIEVDWTGARYRVDMDPKAKDRSGQVLRVLTQLVALNRSAKDYPTPAVVPIISH